MKTPSASAQTVLGPVQSDRLGVVLPHEHIFLDASRAFFREPSEEQAKTFAHEPVKIENLWWLRSHRTDSLDNVQLVDYDLARDEVQLFKNFGGGSIVDATVEGLSPNPEMLRKLSVQTGLHIIAATGYYVAQTHAPRVRSLGVEELANQIKNRIIVGFSDTGIKAGIIKVALTRKPGTIEINEERVLRAASIVQRETGAPLSIHPPRMLDHEHARSWWAIELINLLRDNGVDLNKVVFCHMDTTIFEEPENIRRIAESGSYIEFDAWGAEWPYGIDDYGETGPFPSDHERIVIVKELVKNGCLHRLLFSHDIFIKLLLTKYGGYGYAHILRDIVPCLLREGLTREEINTILVKNPQRLLAFE